MSWLAITIAVIITVTIYLIVTAPEGYEDENGFHYGRPDEHDKDFFENNSCVFFQMSL